MKVTLTLTEEEFEQVYNSDLGACGCGNPEEVKVLLKNVLEVRHRYVLNEGEGDYEHYRMKMAELLGTDAVQQSYFFWLEKAELVDHGGSIFGCFLTDKGVAFLNTLKQMNDETDLLLTLDQHESNPH